MKMRLKRVYETPSKSDGRRILVERLWPRGLTKEAASVDCWMKEIAPSPALRSWYGHDPEKWPEFQRRYRKELETNKAAVGELRAMCAKGAVTFVFAAKDEERNSTALLRTFIEEGAKKNASRIAPGG